jgi:hypothetical protein
MKEKSIFTKKNLDAVSGFLKRSPDVDIRKIDLQSENLSVHLEEKKSGKITDETIELLKAYQRLVRIIPDEYSDIAPVFLREGIHSAIQIASMAKNDFIDVCRDKCGINPDIAETVYRNAQAKKSEIVVQYMKSYQDNEPHIKSAKF